MSNPFGSMPADEELAAFGSAVGGLFLGFVTSDVLSAVVQGRMAAGGSGGPAWLHVLFAAAALVFLGQVASWALRLALLAFALGQVISVAWPSLSPWVGTGLDALVACGLLAAAWPHAGRRARAVTVVLFVGFVGFRMSMTRPW